MKKLHSFATACVAVAWATSVYAQEPAAPAAPATTPAPTTAGTTSPQPTVSVAIERVGGVSWSSVSQSDADTSGSLVAFGIGSVNANPYTAPRLGVDYILPMNLTLGAGLGFERYSLSEKDKGSSTDVGSLFIYTLTPRVGYRIAVSPMFDVTPRVGLTLAGGKASSGTSDDSAGVFALALGAEAVGALRATSSFNLLAGIGVDQTISASETTTTTTTTSGSAGTTTTTSSTSEDIKGALFSLQLWLGIGGYL